jgi:FkbM family methyltransferase
MLNVLKDYIKTQPRLYDWLNGLRPLSTDMERWIAGLSPNSAPLRFIQIGASDGLRWDPFRRFIIGGKWQGLLVEPLPDVFALLKQNYAYRVSQGLKFVNAAVSDNDAELSFWTFKEDFLSSLKMEERLRLLRRASFSHDHVSKALDGYAAPLDKIRSVAIPCLTFDSLVDKYWDYESLDLVMIDAEGHDDKIIHGMDRAGVQPAVILFEAHNLGPARREALYEWLTERDYSVRQLGGDAVAVRNKSASASDPRDSLRV